ncbi:MAG: glycerol-3-phosphate 1-O-acyltransferase PlsB, partial [Proteobacteria bacterium]|nr:glycerol-3-phosphate 1-O-acyltransferase PlsB [Pseudomonadota bacterium]
METHPSTMTLVHRLRAIPAKLRAFEFRLSRRLLFAWIKPTFLGCNREALGIDDDDIVCYVLPFRSIADLMVADMACERFGLPGPTEPMQFPQTVGVEDTGIQETRSFFFLGHPEGTFGRRTLRQQSARMTRLIEHQALLDSPVRIIPISLFWGHQPDREKSIFKLLLSENWTVTSRLKKFLAIVFHPNHILVQFGKPFFLDDVLADETDRGRQTRRLMRLLRVHFNNQKQAIIGPDLSHRRTLLNNMLESDDVQKAIERESRTRNLDYARAEKRARAFAHEIASDQSYRVIRFFDVLLTWLWNNLYDGIEVNGIDTVKELAESHEIVYTPCHRSHIDYLLLSYVLYYNGLTPPHIAAGKNLNLPVVGPLLRRAGAFFMRRSFQGDALYRAVFDEYLHQMFTKGYSVEYFIEGSRSRTGRTLPPRTGMVSMTVRSFQRDDSKPIAFLPVYFGYERVLESSSYLSELSGKSKKGESLLDLFKIFSSFKHEFGQVTVNFGEPVLLRGFLDENVPGWQDPGTVSSNEMAASCAKLATRLAKNINAAVAVKATNLVALALLSTERQLILEQHLEAQVGMLREIARGCAPAGYSVIADSNHDIVDTAIRIFGLERIERPFGTIINAS